MIISLSLIMSTAKSANVGFWQVLQLFAPPTNPATHLAQKIHFTNPQKNLIVGVNNVSTNIWV